jgi:hypothetical protein
VLIPLLLPVMVAAVAVVFPRRLTRVVAAGLLGGFVIVAGFTIGLFYLPAAIAMAAASSRKSRRVHGRHAPSAARTA